jgi:hypothetical protein
MVIIFDHIRGSKDLSANKIVEEYNHYFIERPSSIPPNFYFNIKNEINDDFMAIYGFTL